jgi:hypothetical protein
MRDPMSASRTKADSTNHASDATYSVAGNRIDSVGTAELRRQRISHACAARGAKDAVARGVELVRGSGLGAARAIQHALRIPTCCGVASGYVKTD